MQLRGDDGFVEFLNSRTLLDELNPAGAPSHEMPTIRAAYPSEPKRLKIGPTRAGGEFCRKEIGRPQQRPPPPSASSASASAEGETTGEARGREEEDNVAMANFSPLERRNGGRGEKREREREREGPITTRQRCQATPELIHFFKRHSRRDAPEMTAPNPRRSDRGTPP